MSGGSLAAGEGAAVSARSDQPRRPPLAASAAVGMLGGTFDPIHVGHLALAESARLQLGLDEVLFVPAGRPPHKRGRPITPARDRLAMVELAIAGTPGFAVSRIEIDRAGPSYTIDTVESLIALAAAGDRPIELTVILSAETFADLPTWHEPDRLLRRARIAVAPRPGHPAPVPERIGELLPGSGDRIVVLDGPHLDVSASAIRARVAAGRPIDAMVPPAVASYIEKHNLYRESP